MHCVGQDYFVTTSAKNILIWARFGSVFQANTEPNAEQFGKFGSCPPLYVVYVCTADDVQKKSFLCLWSAMSEQLFNKRSPQSTTS